MKESEKERDVDLTSDPPAVVLANARPPAFHTFAPYSLVLADARPPA